MTLGFNIAARTNAPMPGVTSVPVSYIVPKSKAASIHVVLLAVIDLTSINQKVGGVLCGPQHDDVLQTETEVERGSILFSLFLKRPP